MPCLSLLEHLAMLSTQNCNKRVHRDVLVSFAGLLFTILWVIFSACSIEVFVFIIESMLQACRWIQVIDLVPDVLVPICASGLHADIREEHGRIQERNRFSDGEQQV